MKKLFLILLVPFIFTSCVVEKTPYTKRSQLLLVSEEEEKSLGSNASKEILKTSKLSSDGKASAMVAEVGEAIAKVSNRDFKWEFYLIDEEIVNAFCLPGGKVFIYSGLMKLIENSSQLATVVSHEVAHAIARHGAERMSMQQATDIGKSLLSLALGVKESKWAGAFDMAYGIGANVGLVLPYSRKQEFEADKIGLILMAKSGFNLSEALTFWEKMKRVDKGSGGFAFLRTHPTDEERIENIKKILPNIKKEYIK